MSRQDPKIFRPAAESAHKEAEQNKRTRKGGQEAQSDIHAELIEGDIRKRIVEIERRNIKAGNEVVVLTQLGEQKGKVDSIDGETGRVWVRGIDPEDGHEHKPTLCSPFAMRNATKKELEN